jgi:uncharacterized membrane protein
VQNPHPLVVHFPLALLLTSVVAALYAAARGAGAVAGFARALLWLGTAACAVAVITGFLAAQSVAPVKAAADTIHEHQNFAYALLALAATLSGWSFVAWMRTHAAPRPTSLWVAAQVALGVLLVLTGRDGGRLVHNYGVGTALTAPGGQLHESRAAAPTPTSPAAPPRPAGSDFH